MVKTDLLSMAAKNLLRRKGRTFLTMLGVLIGTTSIVVMVSLGLGMQKAQEDMYAQWGSLNEIQVNPSYDSYGPDGEEKQEKLVVLNDETVETFQAMEGVAAVVPVLQVSADQATCGKMEGWLELYGVDPAYMETLGFHAAAGRLLQPGDHNVVLFGAMMSQNFYDPNDAGGDYVEDETWEQYQERAFTKTQTMLDQKVNAQFVNRETERAKKQSFQVVGILDQDSGNARYNAYAPIDTVQKLKKLMLTSEERKQKKRDVYSQILIVTEDISYTNTIAQTLKDSGYNYYSMADDLQGMEDSSRVVQMVLGGIGGITLLVAAIGIINTMVMSIYERTKEIAIMKVIGATFSDIRLMFLAEAGMIGFFGGLLGLGFSYTLSFVINQLSGDFMGDYMGTGEALSISIIPWWLALFAIGFSILIGLLAGVYPANRAVKLSPIEAMRNN